MSGVQGCIETLSREFVGGWAVDPEQPGKSLTVELMHDGLPVARAIADRPRPDLAHFHAEHQKFGFAVPMPAGVIVDNERIAVRVVGTQTLLQRWEGAPSFEGKVERVTERSIFGWAWRVGHPRERVSILVRHAGAVIGRARADRFRHDLLDAGVGDGYCSFQFDLAPGPIDRLDPELLDVVYEKGGDELEWIHPRARRPAAPAPPPVSPQPAPAPARTTPVQAAAPGPAPAAPQQPARPRAAAAPSRIKLSSELLESMRGSVPFGDEDSLF